VTRPPCANNTPREFAGHWREWHRGHGCDKDDGHPRHDRPIERSPSIDHSALRVRHFEPLLGFCTCEHCEKLPEHDLARPENAVACPACEEPPGIACDGPMSHPSRKVAHDLRRTKDRAPVSTSRLIADPTAIECPTCDAWVGWACKGRDYGYHAAGYHPRRHEAAQASLEEALKKITPKTLKEMRERYAPPADPVCPVCQEPMGIVSMGGGPTIFACDGRLVEDDVLVGWAEGRSPNDDHYSRSRTVVYRLGNSDVIALIDAYELLQNPHGRPEAP